VHETPTSKALHFSMDVTQSRMDVRRPDALELAYTRTMMGFLLFVPAPASIAMIGLGGGSLAKFCHRHLPHTLMCVVEINAQVIALRDRFRVPPDSARFVVLHADGAQFVRLAPRRFDVLLVDGYDASGLPRRLSSQRFYADCADLLAPGGVCVVNLPCLLPSSELPITHMRRAFSGEVLVVVAPEGGHRVVFACRGPTRARPRTAPPTRPRTLDGPAWATLQGEFAGIVRAWQEAHP